MDFLGICVVSQRANEHRFFLGASVIEFEAVQTRVSAPSPLPVDSNSCVDIVCGSIFFFALHSKVYSAIDR